MSPVAAALMTKPRFFKPFLIASIKQTMKEQHVSGAELARRTGYVYTTLQRKLAGKSRLYVPDVLRFADALDTLAAERFENMEAAAEWIVDSSVARPVSTTWTRSPTAWRSILTSC